MKPHEKATIGIARVGTTAVLNFSFAFLRRAWRSGKNNYKHFNLINYFLHTDVLKTFLNSNYVVIIMLL